MSKTIRSLIGLLLVVSGALGLIVVGCLYAYHLFSLSPIEVIAAHYTTRFEVAVCGVAFLFGMFLVITNAS